MFEVCDQSLFGSLALENRAAFTLGLAGRAGARFLLKLNLRTLVFVEVNIATMRSLRSLLTLVTTASRRLRHSAASGCRRLSAFS